MSEFYPNFLQTNESPTNISFKQIFTAIKERFIGSKQKKDISSEKIREKFDPLATVVHASPDSTPSSDQDQQSRSLEGRSLRITYPNPNLYNELGPEQKQILADRYRQLLVDTNLLILIVSDLKEGMTQSQTSGIPEHLLYAQRAKLQIDGKIVESGYRINDNLITFLDKLKANGGRREIYQNTFTDPNWQLPSDLRQPPSEQEQMINNFASLPKNIDIVQNFVSSLRFRDQHYQIKEISELNPYDLIKLQDYLLRIIQNLISEYENNRDDDTPEKRRERMYQRQAGR